MSSAYSTRPITEDQIDLAYMLVELARSDIRKADWQAFCHRVVEWRGATGLHDEVFVANDADGHIRGLFVTEMIQSLLFGRVLDLPLFVTLSAGDEDGVILSLMEAARKKAREAGCGDMRIWSQGGQSWSRATTIWQPSTSYTGVRINVS